MGKALLRIACISHTVLMELDYVFINLKKLGGFGVKAPLQNLPAIDFLEY